MGAGETGALGGGQRDDLSVTRWCLRNGSPVLPVTVSGVSEHYGACYWLRNGRLASVTRNGLRNGGQREQGASVAGVLSLWAMAVSSQFVVSGVPGCQSPPGTIGLANLKSSSGWP